MYGFLDPFRILGVPGTRIRVVIANPTRFLRDALYDAIQHQPDFEVVGEVADESTIPVVADRLKPDCLIVPLEQEGGPTLLCDRVLGSHPSTKIVAIGQGSDVLAIYWRCKQGHLRCTYDTASRKGILRALRFSVA